MTIKLPKVTTPLANYLPYTISDKTVYISGQLPMEDGKLKYKGNLGDTISLEDGIEAAKLCILNVLAHLQVAATSLDNVKRCLKLTGFVSAIPSFEDHPQIINGASDLLVELLGERGKHARAAVGVSSLPLGAAVEIEAIFELK